MKIILTVFCLSLTFSAMACGGSCAKSSAPATSKVVSTPMTVADFGTVGIQR